MPSRQHVLAAATLAKPLGLAAGLAAWTPRCSQFFLYTREDPECARPGMPDSYRHPDRVGWPQAASQKLGSTRKQTNKAWHVARLKKLPLCFAKRLTRQCTDSQQLKSRIYEGCAIDRDRSFKKNASKCCRGIQQPFPEAWDQHTTTEGKLVRTDDNRDCGRNRALLRCPR